MCLIWEGFQREVNCTVERGERRGLESAVSPEKTQEQERESFASKEQAALIDG